MSTMRALVLTGPGLARVQDVEVPEPGPGDVVVRSIGSACAARTSNWRRARWRTWRPAGRPTPCAPVTSGAAWSAPSAMASIRPGSDDASRATRCSPAGDATAAWPDAAMSVASSWRSGSRTASRAHSPNSCACRPAASIGCPTPSTTWRARWSSPVVTPGAPPLPRTPHPAYGCSCGVPGRSGCSRPPSPPPPGRRSTWSRAGRRSQPGPVVRRQWDVVARSPP